MGLEKENEILREIVLNLSRALLSREESQIETPDVVAMPTPEVWTFTYGENQTPKLKKKKRLK